MTVSIIMPVFNREAFLATAIDSVIKQSYADIELIIIDDGSTDSSAKIALEFQQQKPDSIAYLHQSNSGAATARNYGLKVAKGDLIAFLDSDDYYHKEKISKQVALYQNHPDAAFIYSGYIEINKQGQTIKKVLPTTAMRGHIYNKLWSTFNPIFAGSMMTTKKNMLAIGGFNGQLRGCENHDLRVKLASLGKVEFIAETLTYYRKHEGNKINDIALMDKNFLAIVDNHFGAKGINNRKLWKSVMSKFYYKKGMREFEQYNFAAAKKPLLNSLAMTPFKPHIALQVLRCYLGRNINSMLSGLKKGIVKRENE